MVILSFICVGVFFLSMVARSYTPLGKPRRIINIVSVATLAGSLVFAIIGTGLSNKQEQREDKDYINACHMAGGTPLIEVHRHCFKDLIEINIGS